MKRYHKKIFISDNDKKSLDCLCNILNNKNWKYSSHCLKRLNEQYISSIEMKKILQYIKELKVSSDDIFEFYKENNVIAKVCFRIKYSEYSDIILVVSNSKTLITIYSNGATDNHVTLKKELYNIK